MTCDFNELKQKLIELETEVGGFGGGCWWWWGLLSLGCWWWWKDVISGCLMVVGVVVGEKKRFLLDEKRGSAGGSG